MPKFKQIVNEKLLTIDKETANLLQNRDILERKLTEAKSAVEEIDDCLKIIKSSKSMNYLSFLSKRLKDMQEGTITLSAGDYFQFWTDIHIKDEIYLFKVTSRILPSYWDDPEMQLYEKRQIDNIKGFLEYNEEKQKSAYRLIEEQISEMLKQLETQYKNARIGRELREKRLEALIERNFERIFIFDPKLSSENINKMAKTIKRQTEGRINIRVISIMMNETSTFGRPQDFGLAITSNGDLFGMFCDVDRAGNPQGGVVIRDKAKISHYLDCYLKIRGKSREILSNCSEKEVKQILNEIKTNAINISEDISDPEIYGNRCYSCLKQAEDMVKGGQWESEEFPLRTWFEIVHNEHKALSDLLPKLQPPPRNILEIGCGPGRVINLILELFSNGKILKPTKIVGYDQNTEIASYCTDTFAQYQNVTIHSHLVGFGRDCRFSPIRGPDRNSFDLIVAISNLVGWQDDREVEWLTNVIKDGLTPGGKLFFTVYRRGFELERARMYKASGDIIKLNNAEDSKQSDIVIVVDAFGGEEHKSKAYNSDELKTILAEVKSELSNTNIEIDYDKLDVGEYMWGILISVLQGKG